MAAWTAACGIAGCQSAHPSATIARTPTDLPMLHRGCEPAVEVFVNGRGPFLFAIDTGASDFARVDSSLVERLGLHTTGVDIVNDATGRNRRFLSTVNLKSLTVGGVEFHDVDASARDFNTNPVLPHIDGILTFDLFADFLLTLDYPAGRVRIERGELLAPAEMSRGSSDKGARTANTGEILPLTRIHGLPGVEVTIAGKHVSAEIDSGNVLCAFLLPASLVRELPLASAPFEAGTARTVSNTVAVQAARLDGSILLGSHEFRDPLITFPAPFDFVNIGSQALREFAITFDQRKNLVRFSRHTTTMPGE